MWLNTNLKQHSADWRLGPDLYRQKFAYQLANGQTPEATLDAFRVVLEGDYWYLQHFWLKFANSLFIALATMLITLAIG